MFGFRIWITKPKRVVKDTTYGKVKDKRPTVVWSYIYILFVLKKVTFPFNYVMLNIMLL